MKHYNRLNRYLSLFYGPKYEASIEHAFKVCLNYAFKACLKHAFKACRGHLECMVQSLFCLKRESPIPRQHYLRTIDYDHDPKACMSG